MATGVDTSENFDATTWPQALFGWHETLATASWQSWQWDAVSSWTDVIFSEASLTVVGLLAPGLSGGESFRMHVHVTLKSKQNMFLACFATVKLFFPSPLWPDFARQVRFVPANTDQNLSNDTSPLPLKSTQKLVDKMLLAWEKDQHFSMTSNLLKTVFLWPASRTVVGLLAPGLSGGEAFQINSNQNAVHI